MNYKAPAEFLKLLIHLRKTKSLLLTAGAIFGLTATTLAQNVPTYIPTNGLVGWWPFNGNANDESGNVNNGTNNGATLTTDRYGNANKAYSFNGSSSFIAVPHNANQLSTRATWNIWVKLNNSSAGNGYYIFGKDDSQNRHLTIHEYRGNSGVQSGWASNQGTGLGGAAFNNQWLMLTATYDQTVTSNNFKFYVNGNLQGTGTLQSFTYSGGDIRFGKSIGSYWQVLNGTLDDASLHNRVLTQQEITNLYLGCQDTITSQPTNVTAVKGSSCNMGLTLAGSGHALQWQSNPIGLGWQNVPNANQYAGATSSTLSVNGLTVSNHNQSFRVIASKTGCADTSNIVKLTISDVASDSLRLLALAADSVNKTNTISQQQNTITNLRADSLNKINTITSLKADTTSKGNRIRQLEIDLANKHDTLYVGSNITTDTLKISIRTGLATTSPIINALKVYPNPAATILYIELDKTGYYVAILSGITGQTVVTPTSGTIDISALANGVYILSIYDANNKLISTNKVSIVK